MILPCPECGYELKCMVVLDAGETMSGFTERLMRCENCLSSWNVMGELFSHDMYIERYFFG